MNTDKTSEILLKLLEIEQNRINTLDSTIFTIKSIAITLVSALVGFAFQEKNRLLLYIGIVATIFFTIINFIYRKVQLSHVERAGNIQKYLKIEYLDSIEALRNPLRNFGDYKKNLLKDYSPIFLIYFPLIIILIVLSTLDYK